ncbi:MAG: RecX family transcriptional regulator [Bacteroidota bacterium]
MKKRGQRFALSFDNGPDLEIAYAVLLKFKLQEDDTVDEKALEAIKREDATFRAKDIGVNYLSYRPRSYRELVSHLTKKGIPADVADEVATRFQSLGMVNDLEFARMFVRDMIKKKSVGEALLRNKLRVKGIARGLVDSVVDELVSGEDQQKAAAELIAKRLSSRHASLSKLDPAARKKRLFEFLLRRGFSNDVARKTIQTKFRSQS